VLVSLFTGFQIFRTGSEKPKIFSRTNSFKSEQKAVIISEVLSSLFHYNFEILEVTKITISIFCTIGFRANLVLTGSHTKGIQKCVLFLP
jgi:hypothetical protein